MESTPRLRGPAPLSFLQARYRRHHRDSGRHAVLVRLLHAGTMRLSRSRGPRPEAPDLSRYRPAPGGDRFSDPPGPSGELVSESRPGSAHLHPRVLDRQAREPDTRPTDITLGR